MPLGSSLHRAHLQVGFSMLGEMQKETGLGLHMLVVLVDTARFRPAGALAAASADVLGALRACPPAAGHSRVQIPGQREAQLTEAQKRSGVPIAVGVWAEVKELAERCGAPIPAAEPDPPDPEGQLLGLQLPGAGRGRHASKL